MNFCLHSNATLPTSHAPFPVTMDYEVPRNLPRMNKVSAAAFLYEIFPSRDRFSLRPNSTKSLIFIPFRLKNIEIYYNDYDRKINIYIFYRISLTTAITIYITLNKYLSPSKIVNKIRKIR